MKTIIQIAFVSIFIFVFSSCSPQNFWVYGNEGTEIYNAEKEKLATISNEGKVKISLKNNDYHTFLLAKTPQSSDYVPFAIDYKKMNLAFYYSIGIIPPIYLFVTIPVGCAKGMEFNRGFSVLKEQNANSDIHFTDPVYTESYKEISENSNTSISNRRIKETDDMTRDESNGVQTQKSLRTLRNYANEVEGEYIGTGKLLLDGNVIETYSMIKVILKVVSKNMVSVQVVESGESFFDSADNYTVTKDKDGNYLLKHINIESATINISNTHKLFYEHPNVNIENQIYTLVISTEQSNDR